MKKGLTIFAGIFLTLALLVGCGGGQTTTTPTTPATTTPATTTPVATPVATTPTPPATGGELREATNISGVNWSPVNYVNRVHGFKYSYPSQWRITQENDRETTPVEIHMADPGSWVSVIADSADYPWTSTSFEDLLFGIFDAEIVTTGPATLTGEITEGYYGEFFAFIDAQWWMHIYSVGYIDGDRWYLLCVWRIDDFGAPLELLQEVAHTFGKASASEIAAAPTVRPTPTPTATTPTTPWQAPLATHTDAENGFSFQYNEMWVWFDFEIDGNLAQYASEQWICPGVRIDRHPEDTADSVFDLIPFILGQQADPESSSEEEITNDHGITATAHVIRYTSPSDGYRLDAKIFGFIKDGEWWTLILYQSDGLGTLAGQDPDRIFNTFQFLD